MKNRKLSGIIVALMFVAALTGLASAQKKKNVLTFEASNAGEWRMDETAGTTAFDSGPNQNHGTVVGGAALMPDAMMGGVLSLTGDGGGVVVPHHADLEPQSGTVLVRIKMDHNQDADVFYKLTDRFVNTGLKAKRQVYGIRVHERGDTSACVANDDPESSSPWTCVYTRVRLKLGEWHMVALRWDGKRVTLFTDGQSRASQSYQPVPGLGLSYSGENPLLVGAGGTWGGPGAKGFSGQMSDFQVFNRALSDQEVRELSR
jgi:hypothetical protein